MFFLLFVKNNKKNATISSIILNISNTFLFPIIVLIIKPTSICSKSLKLLLNIRCKLTVRYPTTPTLNINAIISKILLFILFLSYFLFLIKSNFLYILNKNV